VSVEGLKGFDNKKGTKKCGFFIELLQTSLTQPSVD
jgi:hypothetical protein